MSVLCSTNDCVNASLILSCVIASRSVYSFPLLGE